MNGRPNILFINTDQHTYDAISAYGNTFLHTPNIDRLHKNGTSFMRSYSTDPVCVPARTSWATGLYTSEAGTPFNGGRLHDHIPDIGQLLNASGYGAYHCGKWHVSGRDVTESFKTLYFGAVPIGAGGAEYHDSVSTHAVLDFLSTYDREEPFYLQIGYVDPHDICEYEHNFEEKEIPDPIEQGILKEEDLPPLPPNFTYDKRETLLQMVIRRDDNSLIHWPILRKTREWSELQWRYLIWNHYRFVEKVDREIGLILNALSATRFKDNTIIIFSIDHGEAYGQHQMFQKFTLYEESARVPLIVSTLGDDIELKKNRFDWEHLISGVDIFATICDYAEIDIPESTQGESIRALAEGRSVPWRDYAYIESTYWGRAVVTDRYKYVTEYKPKKDEDFVPPGPDTADFGLEQLFDLSTDPRETKNIAYEPDMDGVTSEMRDTLITHERQLNRIALLPGHPQEIVTRWGARLKERWKKEEVNE